jgi:hypothetical protein
MEVARVVDAEDDAADGLCGYLLVRAICDAEV